MRMTYGEEEVLDREVPELPRFYRIVKVLFVKVLVGSYRINTTPGLCEMRLTTRSKRSHSHVTEVSFLLRQEFGSLWVIW